MDIHGYHLSMAKTKSKRKRPAVLVRFYPDDLARLSRVCAERCTPRENYIRRCVLAQVSADEASTSRNPLAKVRR